MIFFDIDTQHDFMDHDGALAVPSAEAIKMNVARLLRAAGEQGVTTVSSQDAHAPDDPEFKTFPPHCVAGTPGARRIFAGLPRLPRREIAVATTAEPSARLAPATHYLINKQVFDVFSNRWLNHLREHDAFTGRECVVFGVATDYCVRLAALGLARAGAQVKLVEDAVRGVSEATTAEALAELRAAGVEFTTTDEVLKSLARNKAVETPKETSRLNALHL